MSKIAILVSNKSIELIVEGKSKKLDLPHDTLQNQEVVNGNKYTGLVTNFFNENNLVDQKVVIVLSQSIIYDKQVSFDTPEEEQKVIEDFLNTIPFDNKKITVLKIPGDKTTIIAVNKDLYSYLLEVCGLLQLKVEAVVPLEALGEIDKGAIIWKTIPPLLDKVDSTSKYNFLTVSQEFKSKNSSRKYIIATIIILIIAGLLISAEVYLKFFTPKNTTISSISDNKKEISSTPVASPSATIIPKDKIIIEVLNGSGIAGEALDIKNQLSTIGYSKIETGNYEGSSSAQTSVSFSKNVSGDNQFEIITFLKTIFTNVQTLETAPANFDVTIITGKRI